MTAAWHSPCLSFPPFDSDRSDPESCGKASHAYQLRHARPGLRNARRPDLLAHPPDPHGQPILTFAWPPHVSARPGRKVSLGDRTGIGFGFLDPAREGYRHARRDTQAALQPQSGSATVVCRASFAPLLPAVWLAIDEPLGRHFGATLAAHRRSDLRGVAIWRRGWILHGNQVVAPIRRTRAARIRRMLRKSGQMA